MKINNYQNNPSFRSRFEFIPNKNFDALEVSKKAIEVGHSIYGDFKTVNGGGNIYTKYIASCTAYGLTEQTKRKAILGHYNKGANRFLNFVRLYTAKGRALAIGGDINEMREYFEHDIKAFKEAKLPTTIFWGQDRQCSNAWFNADEDIWYIASDKGIESIKDLKSAYKVINVAEGDEVYIKGKYVEPKLINQNNEGYMW